MAIRLKKFIAVVWAEAKEWSRGKNWLIRLPVLLYFFFVFVQLLSNPSYGSLLSGLNLGIHELGHLVFSFFGRFLNVLGGTLLECLAPVLGMINFYRQKDFFALALCFGWLSTAFFSVANYVADARAMNLPLVSPFPMDPQVLHDWNYLLGSLGILQYDFFISGIFRSIAVISMLICIISGVWLMLEMKFSKVLGILLAGLLVFSHVEAFAAVSKGKKIAAYHFTSMPG